MPLNLSHHPYRNLDPFGERAEGPPQSVQGEVGQIKGCQRTVVCLSGLGNLSVL